MTFLMRTFGAAGSACLSSASSIRSARDAAREHPAMTAPSASRGCLAQPCRAARRGARWAQRNARSKQN
eukprot:7654286-Pyramimonas_sp.AAC.1